MKIYKLSVRLPDYDHRGYSYYASRRAANAVMTKATKDNQECEIEAIVVGRTKKDIIHALNIHAAHADNG